MIKRAVIIFLFLCSGSLFATPSKIEFIFLSEDTTAYMPKVIDQKFYVLSSAMASKEDDKCIPMGDGCFHPQIGFIEDPDKKEKKIKQPKIETKTFNAIESQLVDCKKDYYFDIYCGKSKKIKGPPKGGMEIWIDTSSSMRNVDYSSELDFCKRRSFINKLMDSCGKVDVFSYNTSKKLIGTKSDVCINYGNNNPKRIIEWLKASTAKHLIVVTDIEEINQELKDFLDANGAEFRGADVERFTASKLVNYGDDLLKTCKKL